MKKIRPKLRFSCFSGEDFGTILSRRSRLSRTSRAPSRLIRPRPIDCDARHDRQTKSFPVFDQLFFLNIAKKKLASRARHLVLIYTPKEAHSRNFVTGGSVIA
jgi:hypothetical protein